MNLSTLLLFTACLVNVSRGKRPNFVIILTDDQDVLLDSLAPLKKIENYLTKAGVSFSNAVSISYQSHRVSERFKVFSISLLRHRFAVRVVRHCLQEHTHTTHELSTTQEMVAATLKSGYRSSSQKRFPLFSKEMVTGHFMRENI